MNTLKKCTLKRVKTIIEEMPIYWFIPAAYLLICTLLIPMDQLANWLNIPEKEIVSQQMPKNIWLKYLMVVLVAPVIETFLFQAVPYYFLSLFRFIKRNVWVIILVSSICFGTNHVFSIQYMILTTIIGFILISTYIIRAKKNDQFLCTYLIHALFNFMAITLPSLL